MQHFSDVKYGKGGKPFCKFRLSKEINAGFVGTVYGIDVALSDDLSRYDIWLESEENGNVYYRGVMKRLPEGIASEIYDAVSEAVGVTKEYTRKFREENFLGQDSAGDRIMESIRRSVKNALYEHRNVIYNLDSCVRVIEAQWESPDDQWMVVIEQRLKDYKHYNQNHKFNFGDKGFKKWSKINSIDGTHRENHVGYVLVKGNTKEECVDSLKHAVVHLNDWAAKMVGRKDIPSQGAMEGVIEICNRFFARAYMNINKRSGKMVDDRIAKDKAMGLFKGRELQHRMGQAKENDDATVKWTEIRPWGMIDCDVDDAKAQAELEKYLKDNGIEPFDQYESHDGKHYILKTREAAKLDFSFLAKYNSRNRRNDPNCEFKGDAKMILYSPTGI